MKPLNIFIARWRFRRDIHLIALIVFFLHAILVSPIFFPPLNDIGVWDEATYINEGRELLDGKLPSLTMNPAVAGLYGLTYLPVQTSPYWMVHSCSIARFVLFALLWLASFLVACELAGLASPLIMIALVTISPVFVQLLTNGTIALFAAMSGFALWQFLSFQRTRELKHLWLCSFFLGLAALSRNEGPVLFLPFLGLSLALCIPAGIVRKGLTACLVPFTALVGGYILLYGLCTGDFKSGNAERSYSTFEQGQGLTFEESNGQKQYVKGLFEARRLFGTPEENHYSVLTAIRRNPTAYLQRILPVTKHAIKDAFAVYSWYFGLFCFAFAVRGIIELVKRKSFMLLATLLLWPSYCVLYVLLCFQPSHWLIPFLSVFSLASVGISAFSLNLASRRERYLWSAGFLVLAVAAAARGIVPNGPLTAILIMSLGLWLIWLVVDRYGGGVPNMRTIGCLILLSVGLIVRFGLSHSEARLLGSSADEQAVLYLTTHFERGTRIGALGPGKIWGAKLDPVTMERESRHLKSAQDVSEWMARERVEAIYADDYLRKFEPAVWDTLQKQIGNGLSVAFQAGEGAVQILVRTPSQ